MDDYQSRLDLRRPYRDMVKFTAEAESNKKNPSDEGFLGNWHEEQLRVNFTAHHLFLFQ